ncbi:hypothetical protein H2248_002525 [Termitomyces sp. 'cryptogamus']|nr:hypothetical protein H2248_002525 [Termitomyces sp. 'cryptogamus']
MGSTIAVNDSYSLHVPDSSSPSMQGESKSVRDRYDSDICIHQVIQVYPNVNRRQLHSFIENNTNKNPHIIVDRALSAIRSGSINLEAPSLGKSSVKRKYSANEEHNGVNEALKRAKVDSATRVRPRRRGPDYVELAVSRLHEDFYYVEERLIRGVFKSCGSCYALTHLFLLAKQREVLKRLHLTAVPSVPNLVKSDKGKSRAMEDAEFDCERKWLLEFLTNQEKGHARVVAEGETLQDQIEVIGDGERMIDCGCCFTEYPSVSLRISPRDSRTNLYPE